MGCQKELDFATPPATGAHLSYYWTMDEAGDLDKVDSASGHIWDTASGSSSPPGLFSNGIQLDCTFVGGFPFFHGMWSNDDPGLAFDATTSTGVSMCFWFKKTVASDDLPSTLFEVFVECYDPAFTNDAELLIFGRMRASDVLNNIAVRHRDFTASIDTEVDITFNPVVGSWHMIAATVDLGSHTLNAYVDGVLVASTPDAGTFYTTPQGALKMRMDFGVAGNAFTAVVDEFLLSLKGALSPAQVLALYNSGAGVTWPNITPIVPYP